MNELDDIISELENDSYIEVNYRTLVPVLKLLKELVDKNVICIENKIDPVAIIEAAKDIKYFEDELPDTGYGVRMVSALQTYFKYSRVDFGTTQ